MNDILNSLYQTIQERKTADPETSYVAKLHARGPAKIAQKLGEEAVEMVIEAIRLAEKPDSEKRREALKGEAADLLFHYLVVLAQNDIKPEDILAILEARMGVSGIEEKQNRSTAAP